MRALNICGVLVVWSVVAVACGGESDIPKSINSSEGGEGGDNGSPSRGGSAGDVGGPGEGGVTGEAGASSTTGGKGGGGKGGSSGAGPTETGGVGAAPAGGKGGGTPTPGGGRPGAGGAAPAGGVDPGGSPGTGGTTVEGCREVQQPMKSADYCTRNLECPNDFVYLSCVNQGLGSWWCDCSTSSRGTSYEISGLSGPAVCDAVIESCSSGNAPEPTGPLECAFTFESRQSTFCELQERCVQSVEVSDGVEASIATSNFVSCSSDGLGRMYCSCSRYPQQFQISGQDGTQSCDTMAEICKDGDPIEFGEETCMPSFQSGGMGYCESQQTCTSNAELGNGAVAIKNRQKYISCSTSPGVGSTCNCYDEDRSLRFDIPAPTNDLGACTSHLGLCGDVDSIEPSGDVTCTPSFQSASGTYCDAGIDCKQQAAYGDQTISVYGSLHANCSLDGDAYVCSCNAGGDFEQIEVDASTAWDACSAAVQECPKVVDVKIGDSGIGRPPPFPIPL